MKTSQGFTLIEMAIALAILSFVLGGLLIPLTTQISQQRTNLTQQRLEEIKEALLGFAILYKRLPCPASDNQLGKEDSTLCEKEGYLPWAVLGVGRYDGWGRPFRYRAEDEFVADIRANQNSGLEVIDHAKTPCDAVNKCYYVAKNVSGAGSRVAAIIFSYGNNGVPDSGNNDLNKTYVQDLKYRENGFDDVLTWLSVNILTTRLVAIGKWP
jgi:prepilin-type N-terminal cleavage/methylation domain-containing protein